jgi:uncharacterized protein
MIDLSAVVGFQWDDGNAHKSQYKHDVSPAEAEQVFFNQPLLLVEDVRHSSDESRFHAFGVTDGARTLHITFTLRVGGSLIRVISARDMSLRERKWYATQST